MEQKKDIRILVVSFGTSFKESREKTIGATEQAIARAYPDCEVKRAFTSKMIKAIMKKRDGIEVDNVKEALERAVTDGCRRLIIQPTHLMSGIEYEETMETIRTFRDQFEEIRIGKALLASDEDLSELTEALKARMAPYMDGHTAAVFMGHGTTAEANAVYTKLQAVMKEQGCQDHFIGTVEAKPDIDDLLGMISGEKYQRVVMAPLMVVAGDHATNDMAGDEEDSWKSRFRAAGFETVCLLEGLGQLPAVQQMYVRHVKESEALK